MTAIMWQQAILATKKQLSHIHCYTNITATYIQQQHIYIYVYIRIYKPTCILCSYVLNIYFVHFVERTLTRFPFFMVFLKFFKKSVLLRCDGIVFYILGARYSRLSKPWFTVFKFHIWNNKLWPVSWIVLVSLP